MVQRSWEQHHGSQASRLRRSTATRDAVPLKVARLDITPGKPAVGVGRGNSGQAPQVPAVLPIFKVYFEIDAKDARGNPVAIVADGTMNNAALPNRWITGTWTQTSGTSTVTSEFRIVRQ